MAKFTINDYDKILEDIRIKHRKPTGIPTIQRLRDVAKRIPKVPRLLRI